MYPSAITISARPKKCISTMNRLICYASHYAICMRIYPLLFISKWCPFSASKQSISFIKEITCAKIRSPCRLLNMSIKTSLLVSYRPFRTISQLQLSRVRFVVENFSTLTLFTYIVRRSNFSTAGYPTKSFQRGCNSFGTQLHVRNMKVLLKR